MGGRGPASCRQRMLAAPLCRSVAMPCLAALTLRPANTWAATSAPQVNAFCNTDDITWGTKNLDTKKDATEAKHLMKSGLAYTANQVGTASGGVWQGGGQLAGIRHCTGCMFGATPGKCCRRLTVPATSLLVPHLHRQRKASPSGRQ